MIRKADACVHRGAVGLHVRRVEDVVDAEAEDAAVVADARPDARLGVGVAQGAADGAVGVGEGRVVEVATDDQAATGHFAHLLGHDTCLLSADAEGLPHFGAEDVLHAAEGRGVGVADKIRVARAILLGQLEGLEVVVDHRHTMAVDVDLVDRGAVEGAVVTHLARAEDGVFGEDGQPRGVVAIIDQRAVIMVGVHAQRAGHLTGREDVFGVALEVLL